MIEAFPLHWPTGYTRTKNRERSQFKQTMEGAQRFLREEIRRLGASRLIISTNIPLRNDGGMYASYMGKRIDDPGVAIYFKYKSKDISMCCDKYQTVWENTYALGKGIEALRGMERWGVSDFIDRAFTGFTALPPPKTETWYSVLEVPEHASVQEIKDAYRKKVKTHHPDAGGSADSFRRLNEAYQTGMSSLEVV